jgi:4-hydroxythreonine-4-phosphate dehydrogenase
MTVSPKTPLAPLAVTMGDPAGIGPEIVAKLGGSQVADLPPFLAIGDVGILQRAARFCGVETPVVEVEGGALGSLRPGVLNTLQAGPPLPPDLAVGEVSATAGAAAYAYVARGVELALGGQVSGLVTAPINKEGLKAAGVAHPGHTEILAELSGAPRVAMMLANDELRVLLVSIHVPLAAAIEAVTVENELRAIRFADTACRAFGVGAPRIAVAGLNPHAGENGLFGRQDMDVIAPAIAAARAEGLEASGPWPGDTIFMRARRGEFDVVVAQYHDQGLIPVKYLGIDDGVNITVGLPFVRTSVDHGTAYDIAGTGKADPASLAYALRCAAAMAGWRRALPAGASDRGRPG